MIVPWLWGKLQVIGAPPVVAATCPTAPLRFKLTVAEGSFPATASTHVPDRLLTVMPAAPGHVTYASFVLSSSIVMLLPPACSKACAFVNSVFSPMSHFSLLACMQVIGGCFWPAGTEVGTLKSSNEGFRIHQRKHVTCLHRWLQ